MQNQQETVVFLRTLLPEILPPSWQFCCLNLCLYRAGETEWYHFTVHGSHPAILRKNRKTSQKMMVKRLV